MLQQTALFAATAALGFALAPSPADAAPDSRQRISKGLGIPLSHFVRHDRPRSRSLTIGAATGDGPCGVWRCTWPTSDGGCLVWEKTKCKVINPFD